MRDGEHDGAGDCGFEVLSKSVTPAEPGKSSLHRPAPKRNFEALGSARILDDLPLQ